MCDVNIRKAYMCITKTKIAHVAATLISLDMALHVYELLNISISKVLNFVQNHIFNVWIIYSLCQKATFSRVLAHKQNLLRIFILNLFSFNAHTCMCNVHAGHHWS